MTAVYKALYIRMCLFQWPRGLRRGSAASHLLGLRVRTPPAAWMSVSCVCCVLSGREASASGWSLPQRSPTECGVSTCDREAPITRPCLISAQYIQKRNGMKDGRTGMIHSICICFMKGTYSELILKSTVGTESPMILFESGCPKFEQWFTLFAP